MDKIKWLLIIGIKWFVILGIILIIGSLLYSVFQNSFRILKMLSLVELIIMTLVVLFRSFYIFNIIILLFGCLMCFQYNKNLKQVPKEYRQFASVKDTLQLSTAAMYGYGICSIFIFLPKLKAQLPIVIDYFEQYMYVNILICACWILFVMQKDLKFPKMMRNWIDSHEVITQEMLEDFIESLTDEIDNPNEADEKEEEVLKTMMDFVKIGILEIDEENHSFRKKK